MRLIIFIILLTAAFFGYRSYITNQPGKQSLNLTNIPPATVLGVSDSPKLGAIISSHIDEGITTVKESLGINTDSASADPVINTMISHFQQELSKLPEDQIKKIQYNYCKSIVQEYESSR